MRRASSSRFCRRRVSRSLRRSARDFEIRVDTAFEAVIAETVAGSEEAFAQLMNSYAAKIGMKCVVIQEAWVPHEDAVYDRVGNIMMTRLMGADEADGQRLVSAALSWTLTAAAALTLIDIPAMAHLYRVGYANGRPDPGFPLVMKIQSRDIPHKSEVGGVKVGSVEDIVPAPPSQQSTSDTIAKVTMRLNKEINAVLADPTMEARIANFGYTAFASSSAEFGKFIRDELARWAKVVKESGAKTVDDYKSAGGKVKYISRWESEGIISLK